MRNFFGLKFFEHILIFGILFGLCIMAYSNGLHNAFMWDDGPIFSDIKLKNIKFLPNAFSYHSPHSDQSDGFVGSTTYYRPMAYVIALLSYQAFGDHPFGYHALNLFLFTLMCFTVYIFIDLFFKNRILALATSILFALHPINVFFVDYITSGIHSLRFICMFMSVILFLKALGGVRRYVLYFTSLMCFIVALLCHETSFVLPFYIILAAFYFNKMELKKAVFKSWPYWLTLILYLFFRFQCTGLRSTLPAAHVNPVIYLATFSKIIFLYVSKLIFPQGIVFFWNSPWMTGLNAFIWIVGLLIVLSGWLLLLRKAPGSIYFFCSTWLLLGFIPVFLSAFPPYDKIYYGLIIEPQWVTFASVGFFLFIADAGLKLFSYWKKGIVLLAIFVLILLIILVRHYNEIWGDEYSYYFYWSQQIEPLPPVNYAYLADLYIKRQEFGQARYYFQQALKKKPDAGIYYNLGLIDMRRGNINAAKENFLMSVRKNPNFSLAYNNLGVIYFDQGDYKSAKNAFMQTVKLEKYSIEARSNLGLISLMQGDYRQAVDYYQGNLEIVPYEEASLLGLVQAYAALKDLDHMKQYAQILMTHAKDPGILATLRKILLIMQPHA